MSKLTIPLSRIEGHARVVIRFTGAKVHSAQFQATERRGFEFFCEGAPAEQMPVIVPRICGVCSTAHHIAAVKTLETIFEVTPPPTAIIIRELMMLGQLIQNQATSLFLFTMPDMGEEGVPSIFHFGAEDSSLAPQALQVRRAGTNLLRVAGGQFIHPIRAVIGGVTRGLTRAESDEMIAELRQALPLATSLYERYGELFLALQDRIGTLGDDEPSYYIGAVAPGHAFYGGPVSIQSPDGHIEPPFDVCDREKILEEQPVDTSYSKGTLFKGGVLRANSLARMNLLSHMGTPLADKYMAEFKELWGDPAHAILLFDLARGIELVYCIERAIELLALDLDNKPHQVPYKVRDGEGCGLVEAPRGPLVHEFRIERGLVANARFLIPTQHNIHAINRALLVAAQRYITEAGINLELEKAVGRVVRAFDPCIACATH